MKMRKTLLIMGLVTLVGTGTVRANLVVGGGFEHPIVPFGSPYIIDVTPTGWSGTGDIAEQGYAGAVSSGDGNQWFDLNPGTIAGSGISQIISLDAGTTYNLSFVYNGGGGGSTTEISYSLGTLLSGSVSTAGMNVYVGTPWNTFSTTFVPTVSGLETLSFMPNGTYSGGFIDAVTIIPEPASFGLLGLISGGIYFTRRFFIA